MLLPSAQLTPSGRPVLQQGEVEVSLLDKVDLEFHPVGGLPGQQADAYKNGYAILTNRRLIWVDAAGAPAGGGGVSRAAALPLAAVTACGKKVQYSLKGAKVRLMMEVYTDRQRQPVPASGFHTNIDVLGMRCRGPAPDAFKAQLDEQVRHAVAAAAAAPPPAPAAAAAGPPSAAGGGPTPLPDPYMSPLRAGLQARASTLPSDAAGVPGGLGPPGAAAWPYSPAPSPQHTPTGQSWVSELQPDPGLLQYMVEMGFPRNRSARSLMATRNQGAQEAIDYLLAFGDQPGMDDPYDQPPARFAAPPAASAGPWVPQPSALYPPIMPSGFPPAAALPAPYPYAPQPGAAAPYGAMYGGAPPAESPASGGAGPPLHDAMQQMSLWPHQHPYGSAPNRASTAAPPPPPQRLAIGVAGIVKREQQKTEESGRVVEQAFKDLSALMASAATMVALAEKFRGVMAADGSGAPAGGAPAGGEDPLLVDSETLQQLVALGISSPVTRETAGARYHIELSRQLADFLDAPLQQVGGLMSLPDVYCIFNRARGTELVSPDDLLQAAKLFTRAGVHGLRLRPLSSGVLVIQGPQHSEEQVCAKIAQLTTAQQPPPQHTGSPEKPGGQRHPPLGPGLTAGDVALALGGIGVAIAAEHLLTAEARGVVCRDDGPEGLRFYRNFFRQDRMDAGALGG